MSGLIIQRGGGNKLAIGSPIDLSVDNGVLFVGTGGVLAEDPTHLSYDATAKSLSVSGTANTATVLGSATGNPIALQASGTDASVPVQVQPKGPQGFTQLGPDTYGASGWGGYNVSEEIYRIASTEQNVIEVYLESYLGDIANSRMNALFVIASSAGGTAIHDIVSVESLVFFAQSFLPSGRTATVVRGINGQVYVTGGGVATTATGSFVQALADSGSSIGTAYGYVSYIYDISPSNNTGTAYGFYSNFINSTTSHTKQKAYAFFTEDMAGRATNGYAFWSDSPGVYRIKDDGVTAYYNPSFTKYTPGAANFERIVQQWNSNVAEIGTEAGGTGTLRDLRLIGAHAIVGTDPGGTDALRVGGALTINSATMIQTKTAFTDGVGTSIGTLTNAPAMGDPTKWIPVDDNGTTRYIPAW